MFVYSLPILFTHMQWGSPLELISIVLLIFGVLYISSPYTHADDEQHWVKLSGMTLYQYLLYAWNSSISLRSAFFPFFIFLNLVLFANDTLARNAYFTVSSWDEVHFILLTPVIFWTLVVWRNSYNTRHRYWAATARLLTLSVFFEYALKFLIRKDYPRIFFQCQDIALDYASCF